MAHKQRGDIFQFGDCDKDAPHQVMKIDQEKLVGAPINNLDPERSVGTINYELKLRKATQLALASSSHVKAKNIDLIEGKQMAKSFKKLTKKDGPLPKLLHDWDQEQQRLKMEGLGDKEVANMVMGWVLFQPGYSAALFLD